MQPQDIASPAAAASFTTLEPALVQLRAAAEQSTCATLWARPQGIYAYDATGEQRVDGVWSEAQHQAAWQALPRPTALRRDILAQRVGDHIVIERAATTAASPEALAHSGLISGLAARTLAAALKLGRNIVWTGPREACVWAMTSLARRGAHPGIWTAEHQAPVPPGFAAVGDAQTAWRAGVDRLVAPSSTPQDALAMLATQTGAQAWLSAGRLERTLMRLELASGAGASEAALHILAAVDLVVVVEGDDAPHVTQIAELMLLETAYRPSILFRNGHPIAPQALVPEQSPSFVAALKDIGEHTLVADLAHAIEPQLPAEQRPVLQAPPAAQPRSAPAAAPSKPHARPRKPAPMPSAAPADSQPGWELDRLLGAESDDLLAQAPMAEAFGAGGHTAEAAEAASLAAQFGLGPPPPPRPRPARPSDFSEVLQQSAQQNARPSEEVTRAGHLGAPEDEMHDTQTATSGGEKPGPV